MAPKRKGKKKVKDNHAKTQKKLKVEALLKDFDEQLEDRIKDLQTRAMATCNLIRQKYNHELMAIPVRFHDMTLKQISELNNKTPKATPKKLITTTAISEYVLKLKSMSEKRTLSAKRKKTQRSVVPKNTRSASSSNSHLGRRNQSSSSSEAPNRRPFGVRQQTTTPLRACATPMNRKRSGYRRRPTAGRRRSLTVTPKFDPRTPLASLHLRKPKAGEVIMSLSGSPLQNTAAAAAAAIESEKTAILLSLGNGKVLNIAEPKLDGRLLDENTTTILLNVQQTLAGILQA